MTDKRKDTTPLKRCPFCGGEGTGGNTALGTLYWCTKCGVERRTKEQWNTRADLAPPLPDDVTMSRKVLQGVREALEFYTMFEDRPDEDPNEKFERIGKVFFKETRYLRPGKDCRLHSNEERQAVWDRWRDGKAVRAKEALASLDAVLSEGE